MKKINLFVILVLAVLCFSGGNVLADIHWTDEGDGEISWDSGDVGIGTSDPGTILHINGDAATPLRIERSYTTANINMEFKDATDSWYAGKSSLGTFGISTNQNLGNSAMFNLDPSGNVGIGTTSPSSILNIVGGITEGAQLIISSSLTDEALKDSRIGGAHYTNAEEPINMISSRVDSTTAQVKIGGGRAEENAATSLQFYTAANHTTTSGTERMIIDSSGNVGIGRTPGGSYKLEVDGTVACEELRVLSSWSDFVFDADYNLPSLTEVESYIKENKHLPGIPSENEIEKEGVNTGEMLAKHMQKIEELTLYVIEMKKENEQLKADVEALKNQ